jgi:hypothetical protein
MKLLIHTGTYKDGGSTSWKHQSSGEKYWLNNKRNDKNKGKLFMGNINDKNPKLAKGHYYLSGEHTYIYQ